MLPSIFGENLFDDFFDSSFEKRFFDNSPLYGKRGRNLMKTDVREHDGGYEVDIDLPGFKKDEIKLDLRDGYLTVKRGQGPRQGRAGQEGPLHPPGALERRMQPQLLCRRPEAGGHKGQV